MFEGKDIIATARPHAAEAYILGARAPLTNKHWKGPWDCAEFTSWCAFQTYNIIFGARPGDPLRADAYSGFWWDDAVGKNALCPVDEALDTPGAFLVRKPGDFNIRIGHIAISCGDGKTFEAKSRNAGVGEFPDAETRPWSAGIKLPGIHYERGTGTLSHSPDQDLLMITNPFMRGKAVKDLQKALIAKGVDPGGRDGVFGPLTEAAVIAFQAREGLTVDGVVGKETRAALGL